MENLTSECYNISSLDSFSLSIDVVSTIYVISY